MSLVKHVPAPAFYLPDIQHLSVFEKYLLEGCSTDGCANIRELFHALCTQCLDEAQQTDYEKVK